MRIRDHAPRQPRTDARARRLRWRSSRRPRSTRYAAEPTATVVEFHNAALNRYFITASPTEAATLDAGTRRPGLDAHRRRMECVGDARPTWPAPSRSAASSATARHRPGLAFLHGERRRMRAGASTNPDWTFEGIALLHRSGRQARRRPCGAGTHARLPQPSRGRACARIANSPVRHRSHAAREDGAPARSSTAWSCARRFPPRQIDADIVRLLEQATWGPNDALIAHVHATRRRRLRRRAARAAADALHRVRAGRRATARTPASTTARCRSPPTSYCARDNYTLFQLQREFFRNAVTAPDQLRQRVAFALSQILVTSGTDINQAYAMQRYQQLLADLAFGNFRDVLTEVTLSPAMGNYLDMVNNVKPNAATGVEPNENYARELLQLFSIGTVELELDGTPLRRRRAASRSRPTTRTRSRASRTSSPAGPIRPRRARRAAPHQPASTTTARWRSAAQFHDYAAKTLLDGASAPANLTMSADLANAIDSHVHASERRTVHLRSS